MPFVRTSAVATEIIDDRLVLLDPGRLVGTIQVVPSLASSIDIGSVVQRDALRGARGERPGRGALLRDGDIARGGRGCGYSDADGGGFTVAT